jgi:outer membrane protein insertion porin family
MPMIRSAPEKPTLPPDGPAPRASQRSWLVAAVALAFGALLVSAGRVSAKIDYQGAKILEIRYEGLETIPIESVRRHVQSREGRAYDNQLAQADFKRIQSSGLFQDVKVFVEEDKKRGGIVLIYRFYGENPILQDVQFIGASKIKVKELEENTGLKKGARADHIKAQMAVNSMKKLYEEKGYLFAEIRLLEGDKANDRKIVFEIFEGDKCTITSVSFSGNTFIPGSTLLTKISSKRRFWGLMAGKYDPNEVDDDVHKLRAYYDGLGFFRANVSVVKRLGSKPGEAYLTFVIWEGPQFKVRNITFDGNKLVPTKTLMAGMVMHSGQTFNDTFKEADMKWLRARYGEIGCIDANVVPKTRWTDKPDVVDIVYEIEEGAPYTLGHLVIEGNGRTRDDVLRREAEMAGLIPGEPLNLTRLETYTKRINQLKYFNSNPEQGRTPQFKLVNKRPATQPYGEFSAIDVKDLMGPRLQNPEEPTGPSPSRVVPRGRYFRTEPVSTVPDASPPAGPLAGGAPAPQKNSTTAPAAAAAVQSQPASRVTNDVPLLGMTGVAQARMQDPGESAPIVVPPLDQPPAPAGPNPGRLMVEPPAGFGSGGMMDPMPETRPIVIPRVPQGVGPVAPPLPPPGTRTPPVGEGEPPSGFPSLPGSNTTSVGIDRQEPFPNRSFVDLVTQVDEAPTGRVALSVGVSSYQGLMGSFIVQERNFDLFAIPQSWDELFSGQAFRGRGQNLTIQLSPGTVINSSMIRFGDPYAFGLPIAFTSEAYAWNRVWPSFTEGRDGGKIAVGRQFGTMIYADVAARLENVDFHGFRYPAPADYLAAAGHTTLGTLRPSIRVDNRNDVFSPNRGSYLEAAFEQGWGSFTFPKLTVEGRQYITTGSRPDKTGKRFFTLRGFFGVTGRDTPVYERFFAGNFRSLRGFGVRGVGPFELGQNVGGIMETLGSIEYQFPWTANDKFQQVVFADFGTVEPNYTFTTFRAAVGTGFRIYLPQQMFGNLPLAFDFAFPVVKGPQDHVQIFSFFIGTMF